MSFNSKAFKLLISVRSSVACALLISSFAVPAISRAEGAKLGSLTVYSVTGEHLQANVAINNPPDLTQSLLRVSLADRVLAQAAGIEWGPSHPYLYAEIQTEPSGEPYVKLMSSRPIAQSSLHLLIELSWSEGSYLREYRVPLSVVAATAASSVVSISDQSNTEASKPASRWPERIQVRPGDSLMEIARQLPLRNITIEQATWSIFQSNPRAFAGSVNQLVAGAVLKIPSASVMSQLDVQLAAQKLGENLSGKAPASQATLVVANAQTAVADPGPENTVMEYGARDPNLPVYQGVSSAGATASPMPAADLLAATKALQTGSQANTVESQSLSMKVDESLVEVKGLIENIAGSVKALNQNVQLNSRDLLDVSKSLESLQTDTREAQQTANEALLVSELTSNGIGSRADQTRLVEEPKATPAEVAAETWSSRYFRSLLLLGLAVLLSAWLVAKQIFAYKRSVKTAAEKERKFAEQKARQNTEVIDTPTPTDWFRRHLRSARVTEADLLKALHRYPNRQDLRIRLMERYANRRNAEAFARQGREMFQMTRGHNDEWPRVIQMGLAMELEMEELETSTVKMVNTDEYGLERDIGFDHLSHSRAPVQRRDQIHVREETYVTEQDAVDMELDATAVISRASAREATR